METVIFNLLLAAYEQTYSHLIQQGMEFYLGQHPHAHIELLQYFTVPHLFLQESCRNPVIPVEFQWNP